MTRLPAVVDVFSAIGHPRRRDLVNVLADGDRKVTELVDALGVAQSTVSEHLGILRSVGLVDSKKRGRERVYSFDPRPLREVTDWIAHLEVFWDERFQRLATLLETMDKEDET
ncbi:ArsR/SmtB family transcription factor [Corynebacterium glyciniphilum]|uniref:ArsR/SmtB family transcription factor n=1 Tax=Corynebacterium glyciniphilum TaxID=1404244 RepID=UPI003FD40E51